MDDPDAAVAEVERLRSVAEVFSGGCAQAREGDDDSAALNSVESEGSLALDSVSDEEALAAVTTLLDYKGSPWWVLVSAMLTLFVFAIRKAGALSRLPPAAIPWVAAVLAMVADVVTAANSGLALAPALARGLMIGAAAVGFWELVLKRVTTSRDKK